MNTRDLFREAYRIMRTPNSSVPLVNALYVNHRTIYRAASQCYVNEASTFHGWVNRQRWLRWLERRQERQIAQMRSC